MKLQGTVLACLGAIVLVGGVTQAQKLKIYILAGQSNMEGHAKVETFGAIGDDPAARPMLADMLDTKGKPRVCERVWISYLTGGRGGNGAAHGRLTAGYGARRDPAKDGGKIGPEFTFGIYVSKGSQAPVLLIKTAWGGKSLHTDFRPPSAGPYEFLPGQLARLRKQNADMKEIQARKRAATGRYYKYMIDHVKHVLGDLPSVVPDYDPEIGYEVAGFVWFQGWNDMVDRGTYPDRDKPGGYAQYTECLADLIRDVRKDLGVPQLPFVIGVMGVGGPIEKKDAKKRAVHAHFRAAMAAPAEMKEFEGTVVAVPTAPYWDRRLAAIADKVAKVRNRGRMLRRKHPKEANADGKMSEKEIRKYLADYRARLISPEEEAAFERGASNAGYHYLGSAKTMAWIGRAFAEAMLRMKHR